MAPIRILGGLPLVLIALGLWKKRDRRAHTWLMALAFVTDIALLLYVELTRDAIQGFLTHTEDRLLMVHVAFSVVFILLYFVQIWSGVLNWKRNLVVRPHAWAAGLFVVCRLGGFITSLMLPPGY